MRITIYSTKNPRKGFVEKLGTTYDTDCFRRPVLSRFLRQALYEPIKPESSRPLFYEKSFEDKENDFDSIVYSAEIGSLTGQCSVCDEEMERECSVCGRGWYCSEFCQKKEGPSSTLCLLFR